MHPMKSWRIGTRARVLLRGLRYASILPYVSIDGWLTVDEAITLYELARSLPHEHPLVVEIGSWQGKSTICLGRGLQGKNAPRLCCIDPFDASGDASSAGEYRARAEGIGGPLRTAFEQNLRDAGVRELVDVYQGFSHECAATWRDRIDLLFLDGDHSPEATAQDFRDWAPHVRPGGYLVMHDVVHPVHEGPRRIVEQEVSNNPLWVEPHYADSMLVVRKAMA